MSRWWATLQDREKKTLVFGAVALVIMGGYLFLVEPLMAQREQLATRVVAQRALQAHLERVAQEARALRAGTGAKTPAGAGKESLLAIISKTSRKNGVKESMKRITPEGSGKARIWLEHAAFDQMIAWVMSINERYGIKVENINVSAEDEPGQVRAKLTLAAAE